MEGERLAIVERDNRILLEKMAFIMRTGGSVDNRKEDYMQKRYTFEIIFLYLRALYVHVCLFSLQICFRFFSLNKTKRQRELLRITHENFAILKRLTAKEPHYHHMRWQDEWNVSRVYHVHTTYYHPVNLQRSLI